MRASPSCVVSRPLAAGCCVVAFAGAWRTYEDSRDSGTETGPVSAAPLGVLKLIVT